MRMGWLIAPVIGVAACVGALAWSAQDDNARSDTYKELELFADVLVRVQNEYVHPRSKTRKPSSPPFRAC